MNKTLKSCPFCGDTTVTCAINCIGQWSVMCHFCSATMWGESKEIVINKWNRRIEE